MTVTLADLVAKVNGELENKVVHGTFEIQCDGIKDQYIVAPINRTVLDTPTFLLTVDNVEDATGSMDFGNGVYTFVAPPALDTIIRVTYDHVYWTAAQVESAVNDGVGMLFPAFYVSVLETMVTDGETYEYTLLTPNVEAVKEVSISSTSLPPWAAQSLHNRSSYMLGESYVLRFYNPPIEGSLRAMCICRQPTLLEGTTALSVPDRAASPITSFACYQLLKQKMPMRVRSDVSANVTGQGSLSPRQMNDASNGYMLAFQAQLGSMKMKPWSVF